MSYGEIEVVHTWTDAFSRFWETGIELITIGAVTHHGILEAPGSKAIKIDPKHLEVAPKTINIMLFLRVLDNFQTYIVELLLEVFENRPEIVPKGSISYRELFNISDIEDLRKIAIQRVVLVYYQNVVDLSKEISKNLNFDIFDADVRTQRIRRLVETRNVLIHNRGVINQPFLERCGSKADKQGDGILVPNALRVLRYLDRVAHDIDLAACSKFLPDRVSEIA